jgi:5-methylcytosine-specific restriction endonuclease McrA
MKCNSGGGNTIPQTATLQAAAHRVQGSILETRLNMLISTVGQIGRLPTSVLPRDPEGPFNLSQFVLLGARWNTSRRETRNRGTPYDRPSGVKAKLSTIHNVVVDMLARQRPAFTLTAQYLMAYQPTRTFINANEEGRLCFYCLGLFKKQAFQIDHINPASGRSGVPTVYSDATNLIPVCRSCNTAKGIKYLSTQWLDEQIAERQRQNLPGVEQAIVAAIPAPHGTYLDYVKARRMQILNH